MTVEEASALLEKKGFKYDVKTEENDEVEVDFDTGVITNKTKNKTYQAVAFPPFMQGIINAGGLVEYIKNNN